VVSGPLLAQPLGDDSADREPNDSAASAHVLFGESRGRVDAATDPVDVFRIVAAEAGPVQAVLEAEGFTGEVVLHDLGRDVAARTLDVGAGTVYDVVVRAVGGAGPYRVRLSAGGGDRAPRALPACYGACGEGFVPGQIVAAPGPGVAPAALADLAGCRLVRGRGRLCLLEAPGEPAAEPFRALCDLLCCCARLEGLGVVRHAEPNYYRRLAAEPDDPLFPQQWALDQIHAPAAWEEIRTTDLVVAIVDSGIRNHPDLVDNLVPGYDFEADDTDPTDENPTLSHGTQVAGVIAATGDNAQGICGVFWSAKVMPLRAFDAAGFGTTFDISNAILYAAGEDNESGTVPAELPAALNLSFASSIATTAEEDACAAARANGVFVCAAAGNGGTSTPHYPAAYDSVVSVATTGPDGTRTIYSNFGNWIDIAAPGGTGSQGVLVTGLVNGGQYGYPGVNGTSFSSPHVAAVAAMCRSLAELTADEVEQILFQTAQDIDSPGYDPRTGYGLLDAYAAVLATLGQPTPLLVPYEKVEVRLLSLPTLEVAYATTTSSGSQLRWTLSGIAPGRYRLQAGTDRNFDGDLSGPGELFGTWTDGAGGDVLVVDGTRTGLDFAIAPR